MRHQKHALEDANYTGLDFDSTRERRNSLVEFKEGVSQSRPRGVSVRCSEITLCSYRLTTWWRRGERANAGGSFNSALTLGTYLEYPLIDVEVLDVGWGAMALIEEKGVVGALLLD